MSEDEVQDVYNRLAQLENLISQFTFPDRYEFGRTVKITAPKVGFYNVTPVVRAAAITPAAGGATVDSQARAAINSLLTAIKNVGLTK